MRLNKIMKKGSILIVAMSLMICFVLPVFAGSKGIDGYAGDVHFSGEVYVNSNSAGAWLESADDADLVISGYALDNSNNRANFGSSRSQSTYTSDYVSGVYKYACANFSVYSNDGGANTVYANTIR